MAKTIWNYPVIIDNMMNLEYLFWAAVGGACKRHRRRRARKLRYVAAGLLDHG